MEFDYIIVGAGSAGCVLANRLSARPDLRVLLIEAGGDDRPRHNPRHALLNSLIHVPAGYRYTVGAPHLGWGYRAEQGPVVALANAPYPRGRVLGGTSSINGMIYVRGQAADYDAWSQLGCTGWDWDSVLPLFRRAEDYGRGADESRGSGGPLTVSDLAQDEISEAFLAAAGEAGYPTHVDPNRGVQEGFAYVQTTTRAGRRCSSAVAYLHGAMNRPNLKVMVNTLVTGLSFENGRAAGVRVRRGQREELIACRGEIVLCGGVINSPQLLEFAGIGDPAVLARAGIPVRHALPGVGANLQDHWGAVLRYRVSDRARSLNTAARGAGLVGQVGRYLFRRDGILTSPPVAVMGFARSEPSRDLCDLQINLTPASADPATGEIDRFPGFTIGLCQMRPESRGTVHVKSDDPSQQPAIQLNFLDAAEDRRALVAGLKQSCELAARPPMAAIGASPVGAYPAGASDEDWLEYGRTYGYGFFHGVGTCRMGTDDGAVVDARLRVSGVAGLRVADASIMPRLISGNTNAAAMMIGEQASDLILEDRTAS